MLGSRALTTAALIMGAALPISACGGDAASATDSNLVRVPADLCALLSVADITDATGRTLPPPRRIQMGFGEQNCTSIPATGTAVSFTLFWGNCVDGQPPNMDCLNSVSGSFTRRKQGIVGPVQPIAGLGDQAYCVPGPLSSVELLKPWFWLMVVADTCPQAQKLAGILLTKLS